MLIQRTSGYSTKTIEAFLLRLVITKIESIKKCFFFLSLSLLLLKVENQLKSAVAHQAFQYVIFSLIPNLQRKLKSLQESLINPKILISSLFQKGRDGEGYLGQGKLIVNFKSNWFLLRKSKTKLVWFVLYLKKVLWIESLFISYGLSVSILHWKLLTIEELTQILGITF